MAGVDHYVVTTSLDPRMAEEENVVFLGRWCVPFSERPRWANAQFITPYGLGKIARDRDAKLSSDTTSRLTGDLAVFLDDHLSVDFGHRGWSILIGHWLQRMVRGVTQRSGSVMNLLDSINHGTFGYLDAPIDFVANPTSLSALQALNNPAWNSVVFKTIIDRIAGEQFVGRPFDAAPSATSAASAFRNVSVAKRLYRTGGRLLSPFQRNTDLFIINSYLPRISEFGLHLALRQSPQLWYPSHDDVSTTGDFSITLRRKLQEYLSLNSTSILDSLIRELVALSFPLCFLEGFKEFSKLETRLTKHWPEQPRSIFASNRFDTDDVFKLWVAKKSAGGTKYFVGQHGNNYGTHRHMHPSIEAQTSDAFLTWGWALSDPKFVPCFNFKRSGSRAPRVNNKGDLLVVGLSQSHWETTWDPFADHEEYFSRVVELIQNLPTYIREETTYRMQAASWLTPFEESMRWEQLGSPVKLDHGRKSFQEAQKSSRLTVFTYDSTGLLENLHDRIPTLALFTAGLDHVLDEARPKYEELVAAGVIHIKPQSLASKISEIWPDVASWWHSDHVATAISSFSSTYSRRSSRPIRSLANTLATLTLSGGS